jgi:glycosyltransferase involved in cell wall biosynthesis
MDKLLWFCRTGDTSSLARITDSVLPILRKKFDITLISNKSYLKGIKNIIIGEDTSEITYKDYIAKQTNLDENSKRCINMKYILIQIIDLIYNGDYKCLLICNGIYEIDWFCKIIADNPSCLINKHGTKTKIIVWAPIDYIPCYEIIENVLKIDLFITMTPVMKDIILDINKNARVDWVGHGSEIKEIKTSKEDLVTRLNKMIKNRSIISKCEIKSSDIIILNANNNPPYYNNSIGNIRKRIDITVRSFMKLLELLSPEIKLRTKLWIHSDIKSFFKMLARENINISSITDNFIISNNTLTNEELGMIYKISSISLQTSFAEGWSLTNMESALYDSLQIVPDFLACGFHFGNGKGILIPVTRKIVKNEADLDVVIGEVSEDDTVNKLLEGINLITENTDELGNMLKKAKEYAKSYTWENITKKLGDLLKD